MNTLFQCPRCARSFERLAADGIVPNPGRDTATCDGCAGLPPSSPEVLKATTRFWAKLADSAGSAAALAVALLALAACAWPIRGTEDPGERLISGSAHTSLALAVEDMAALAGCRVKGELGGEAVIFEFKDAKLRDVLDAMGEAYGFTWRIARAEPCEIRIKGTAP